MRAANEQPRHASWGRPKPQVKVSRRVDPIMAAFRKRRLALGMTQEKLANRIGISRNAVSAGEQGRSFPTLRTVGEWAEALGMKLTIERVE